MSPITTSVLPRSNLRIVFSAAALMPLLNISRRREIFDSYRPELHYMRGPGPRWREKHAYSLASWRLQKAEGMLETFTTLKSPNRAEVAGALGLWRQTVHGGPA
jgi:hypothetical protein